MPEPDPTATSTVGAELGALPMRPLPEGSVPVGAVILVNGFDENGTPWWFERTVGDVPAFDALGCMDASVARRRQAILSVWDAEDDG